MTHDQFFKSIKNGDIRPVYLFCGVEQHIKHSALQNLRTFSAAERIERCAYLGKTVVKAKFVDGIQVL